ncbi:Fur family transcriptional regulator [Falsiroseomonas oryzae]|uniref:Fur family transcriptional regulator n=1 Tax=Falsiroseomonas oryzae TaxID=2766473 RepID=UPI0022EB1537|nr:Fur family transcriptional regulator [Roseomonas sp. MO-31]
MAGTTTGPGEAALEAALDRAAAGCLARGAQLTELRRQVLKLVLASPHPVGAYALLDQLRAARPGAAPPTVYRALDFLQEQGLVHRVERLNAFVGCAGPEAHHHCGHGHDHPHQFLICGSCGATAEICDDRVAAAVADAARAAGFFPVRTTVEVEGRCAACAAMTQAAPAAVR